MRQKNAGAGRLRTAFAAFSHPVELTEGKPWRVILLYAAPIILSYYLQQIYTLTDAIICGQVLTAEQVAGVNDTFPLTFIFLQFAFGCTAGFSVITAGCVGSRDARGVRRSFAAQIELSLVISAFLTALSILLLPQMLALINVTPAHGEVYAAARTYCLIIFIGTIAQIGYNLICGILRAFGDSFTPLLFLAISTALNVGLDLLFLVPLRMGPAGAAIATVMAQLLSLIGCTVYTLRKYPALRPEREDWRVPMPALTAHIRQGVPLGLQFSILAIGIIVMQGAVVKFDLTAAGEMAAGTPAQNGFGAANKLINFLMTAYNGLGSGLLGYNAQNYGRGDRARIRRGTLQTFVMMLILTAAVLLCGGLLTLGGAYQHIFLSADKITETSLRYGNTYILVDLALFVILGALFVMRNAVQGISRPGYVLGAGIAELIARMLICAFLPAVVNGGPVDNTASGAAFAAVCFGDPGAWIAADLVLAVATVKYILKKEKTA